MATFCHSTGSRPFMFPFMAWEALSFSANASPRMLCTMQPLPSSIDSSLQASTNYMEALMALNQISQYCYHKLAVKRTVSKQVLEQKKVHHHESRTFVSRSRIGRRRVSFGSKHYPTNFHAPFQYRYFDCQFMVAILTDSSNTIHFTEMISLLSCGVLHLQARITVRWQLLHKANYHWTCVC